MAHETRTNQLDSDPIPKSRWFMNPFGGTDGNLAKNPLKFDWDWHWQFKLGTESSISQSVNNSLHSPNLKET